MVPYPRIHYPLLNYSPLAPLCRYAFNNSSVEQITLECFQVGNQMVHCDPTQGKYMSSVLLYRGDVANNEINNVLNYIRNNRSIRFVDWSPTGFKTGVNFMPPSYVPGGDLAPSVRAVCGIANNTIIQNAWCRLVNKFNKLHERRAFVYHYVGEGMEESTFEDATSNICQLIQDYQEVESSDVNEES